MSKKLSEETLRLSLQKKCALYIDGDVKNDIAANGYMPDEGYWIYDFDFYVDAFSYDKGFIKEWTIDYPVDDDPSPATITYTGKDPQDISDSDISALLSKEIREPEGLQWMPLDESAVLTGSSTETGNGSSTDALSSEDLTVESVTWNNDESEYEYPNAPTTVFTFHMSDGTEQVLNSNYNPMVTGQEMVDIDNDGEEEWIIHAYFANTAGEFDILYAFKQIAGKVVQLYPTTDISALAETAWDTMITGDTANTTIVTIELDGKTINALEVVMFGKADGEVYETYHETLFYNEDHWEELK